MAKSTTGCGVFAGVATVATAPEPEQPSVKRAKKPSDTATVREFIGDLLMGSEEVVAAAAACERYWS
jgi:hypothetical protein